MNVRDQIRRFIIEQIRWDELPELLTDDYPLLDTGTFDSLAISRLVSFLESEFGIEIEDTDLFPENFISVASIAELVNSKRP